MKKEQIYAKALFVFEVWSSGRLPEDVRESAAAWYLRCRDNPVVHEALQELWHDKISQGTGLRDKESLREFERVRKLLGFPEDYSGDRRRLDEKLNKGLRQGGTGSLRRTLFRVAVVLIPALVITGACLWVDWASDAGDIRPVAGVTVSADGDRKEIVLADGSAIILEPNSSVSYKEDFITDRSVSLTGEAMFKVAKAENTHGVPSKFTVTTNHLEITVSGTDFRVSGYSDKSIVALFDGNVEVGLRDDTLSEEMSAGDLFTYDHISGKSELSLIPVDDMLVAGYKPRLRFRHATAGQVLRAVEANFEVTFEMPEGEDLEKGDYSANYEGEILEDILKLFSDIGPYTYRQDGEIIKIIKKQ